MEISLPNEHGRIQILSIHTARMREFKKIHSDVDVKVSKNNKHINLLYDGM